MLNFLQLFTDLYAATTTELPLHSFLHHDNRPPLPHLQDQEARRKLVFLMWWMTHCPNLFWASATEPWDRFSNRDDCKKCSTLTKKTALMCLLVLISSVFSFSVSYEQLLWTFFQMFISSKGVRALSSQLVARSIAAFPCMSWPAPLRHPHSESALSNTRLEIHTSHWTDCVSSTTLRAQLPEVLFNRRTTQTLVQTVTFRAMWKSFLSCNLELWGPSPTVPITHRLSLKGLDSTPEGRSFKLWQWR